MGSAAFVLCFAAMFAVSSSTALSCTASTGSSTTTQTCDDGVTLCYRQKMGTILTQGCNQMSAAVAAAAGGTGTETPCSVNGNPTSCCTNAAGQKIICSSTDFGDAPEEADFASCSATCGTSGTVAMGTGGPLLALALWRLLA